MFRVIFNLGGLSITSWGVMVVIAFAVGIWLAGKRALKYDIPKQIIGDLSVILILAGIVGGRLAFIIENMDYYSENPGQIFKIWEGGLIFYGGVGLAILCGIIFLKKRKVSVTKVMDVVAPTIALGLFFARIGCFLNGCCFGKPTNLPWGIAFPADSPVGWVFTGPVHVHPTQLYSSIAGLAIFGILLKLEKKVRFSGYLFWMFLLLYSIWRFFIDILRYYEPKAYLFWGLTFNQLISILIFLLSIVIILKHHGRADTRH